MNNKQLITRDGFKKQVLYFISQSIRILEIVKSFLWNLCLVLVGILVFYYVGKEINTKYIVIEPFEVPSELQQNGLTGLLSFSADPN